MEIQKIGNLSFYIKGKKENVIINPSEEQLKLKKFESRIVVMSEEKLGGYVDGEGKVVLKGPGEYEVGGVSIYGVNSGVGSTMYVINVDGVAVGYLGNLTGELTDKKIEKIEDLDVLIAPVNSEKLGDGKKMLDWSKKWGANFVIPFGYDERQEELKQFLDAADAEGKEAVDSLKLTGKEELPEGTEVVVLK